MKIGILTLPLHTNYGGNLQAFALMHALKSMGHEPVLIDRDIDYEHSIDFALLLIKRFFMKFVLGKQQIELYKELNKVAVRDFTGSKVLNFIYMYINPRTKKYTSSSQLRTVIADYNLQAIIVGSDQVWRSKYTPNILDYFLSFAKKTHIKRISYAASFGVSELRLNFIRKTIIKNCLKNFDFIGVREDSGVELCKQYFGVHATQVVDPTLLVDKEIYMQVVKNSNTKISSTKNLLVYFLDFDADKKIAVSLIADELALTPVNANGYAGDKERPLVERVSPSVEDWIEGFMSAEFVITDSFHACVFSIIFNKPFIAYGNAQRGLTRFTSLLNLFSLNDRLILSSSELTTDKILFALDWNEINRNLLVFKNNSLDILADSLQEKS